MKGVLILVCFLISMTSQAQFYEGVAKVAFQDGNYSMLIFGRNGTAPSSFIVKNNKLEEGKYYQFYLKKVKYNGTKETAKILYFHLSQKQISIEKRRIMDSINQKFIWI